MLGNTDRVRIGASGKGPELFPFVPGDFIYLRQRWAFVVASSHVEKVASWSGPYKLTQDVTLMFYDGSSMKFFLVSTFNESFCGWSRL